LSAGKLCQKFPFANQLNGFQLEKYSECGSTNCHFFDHSNQVSFVQLLLLEDWLFNFSSLFSWLDLILSSTVFEFFALSLGRLTDNSSFIVFPKYRG
jgi:hypothetical protein